MKEPIVGFLAVARNAGISVSTKSRQEWNGLLRRKSFN